MIKSSEKVSPKLHAERETYAVSSKVVMSLQLLPVLILFFYCLAWFIPETYFLARWASKENGPAETMTFIFLLFGSIIGITLAIRMRARGVAPIIWGFLSLFSVGLFLVAMEEISWGQHFFNFQTPESMKVINEQNEFNLHNVQGLQGHSEYFHLVFGLAGIISIFFNLYFLNAIRVPRMLAAMFFTIAIVAVYDLFADHFYADNFAVNYFTRRLSEINEMIIGIAGFSYVLLLARKFKFENNGYAQSEALAEHPSTEKKAAAKNKKPLIKKAV